MKYISQINLIKGAFRKSKDKEGEKTFVEGLQKVIEDTVVKEKADGKKRADPEVQEAIDKAVLKYLTDNGYRVESE